MKLKYNFVYYKHCLDLADEANDAHFTDNFYTANSDERL